MPQCLSRALQASAMLCVDTCALLLEFDLWPNRCKVPMTFTVRDGIQQESKMNCHHSCKSSSCACAHVQISQQPVVIQPQESFQFGDPADLLACWWLSVGILQLSGGVDVAGTRNPPSKACKPPGSFRSLLAHDQQLRQVTFIMAIESVMQLVLRQLPNPHSRHCRCPIRTLALPSDPNSLCLEHLCPHLQKNRPALHWLPRPGPPYHQTQSSWYSGWVACRWNTWRVGSHEPGVVFTSFRQNHVEPSNMWASSTVHRRLQGIQNARPTLLLNKNNVCPRVCSEMSRRNLSRGGW